MSLTCSPGDATVGGGPSKPGRLGPIDWLSLAAAPTFAIMALLTAVLGGGPLARLCAAGPEISLLTGMTTMYLLMSVFHVTSWLRLLRRSTDG